MLVRREVVRTGEVEVVVNETRDRHEVDGELRVTDQVTVAARHPGWSGLTMVARAGADATAPRRQNVSVGHPVFDDRYLVKTSAPDALACWFGAEEAEAVLATYDPDQTTPMSLEVTPDVIALSMSATRSVPAGAGEAVASQITRVDEAVAAVVFLAGRGHRLAEAWRRRLTPLGLVEAAAAWATTLAYEAVCARGRHQIRIDFPWQVDGLRRAGPRTRLRIAWPTGGQGVVWPRSWRRRDGPRLTPAYPRELDPNYHAAVDEAVWLPPYPSLLAGLYGAGVDWLLVRDQTLELGWESTTVDDARLGAAMTVMVAWCESTPAIAGPYR